MRTPWLPRLKLRQRQRLVPGAASKNQRRLGWRSQPFPIWWPGGSNGCLPSAYQWPQLVSKQGSASKYTQGGNPFEGWKRGRKKLQPLFDNQVHFDNIYVEMMTTVLIWGPLILKEWQGLILLTVPTDFVFICFGHQTKCSWWHSCSVSFLSYTLST